MPQSLVAPGPVWQYPGTLHRTVARQVAAQQIPRRCPHHSREPREFRLDPFHRLRRALRRQQVERGVHVLLQRGVSEQQKEQRHWGAGNSCIAKRFPTHRRQLRDVTRRRQSVRRLWSHSTLVSKRCCLT